MLHPPISLDAAHLLVACSALALGAFVQGAVGFGMGLVAAPLLILIDPGLVPGPLIVAGLAPSALVTWRDRQNIDRRGLRWAVPGLLVGAAVGAAVLSSIPNDRLGLALGLLVLFAVGLSVAGVHVPPSPRNVLCASTLAGFMNSISTMSGPPLALVYQRAPGGRLRGTLAPLFLICSLASLPALISFGRFGWADFRIALQLVPGAVVGFALSSSPARRLDRGSARAFVLTLAAVAGVAAVVRNFP